MYNRKRNFDIPKNIKKMANLDKQKFVKKAKKKLGSKKAAEKEYYCFLMDELPEAIVWCVRYGRIQEAQPYKAKIYDLFKDLKLIKTLSKNRKYLAEDLELLPIIVFEILRELAKTEGNKPVEDPDNDWAVQLNILSHDLLSKKIKTLVKHGVNEDIAFDILSVIPTSKVASERERGKWRYNLMMNVLYRSCASIDPDTFDFDPIVKFMVKPNEVRGFITAQLLVYLDLKASMNMNDNQSAIFNKVTRWCFDELEEYEDYEIADVINNYIEKRKQDEANGKDANRRFKLIAIDNTEHPKIYKVLKKKLETDPWCEKYLN